MGAVLLKLALGLTSGLIGIVALRSRCMQAPSESRFITVALALQLLPTIAAFITIYVAVGLNVTSDVPGYYLPAVREVFAGRLPYRDFDLSYAPFFPYVGAGLVLLWNSSKVFALFAIALNALALPLWHFTALRILEPKVARASTVLYATSGHVLCQALLGTNQAWLAAGLAGSAFLLVRDAPLASGFVQAISVSAVKALAVLFWPVLWAATPHRRAWLVGALVVSVAAYGAFAFAGANVLFPLRFQGNLISSGNLPYLLEPLARLGGLSAPLTRRLFDAVTVGVLGLATLWIYRRTSALAPRERYRIVLAGLALITVLFLLASKKSSTGYAAFGFYPLTAVVACAMPDRTRCAGFLLVFNLLLIGEPGLWFHLHGNGLTLSQWVRTAGLLRSSPLIATDLALIACYAWLTRKAAGAVTESTRSGQFRAPAGAMAIPATAVRSGSTAGVISESSAHHAAHARSLE